VQHRYEVRFAKNDPETPADDAGRDRDRTTIAREAARKLGVPSAENKPLYRVGRNSHTGEIWAYVEWTWEDLRS
jgi:hypothetical protein